MTRSWFSRLPFISGHGHISRPHRNVRLECEPLEDRLVLNGSTQPFLPLPEGWKAILERRTITKETPQARLVKKLYHRYLHRAPSAAELKKGLHQISPDGTAEPLEARMLGSAEFFQKRAGSNIKRFLTTAATLALGHPLDGTTFGQLLNQLKHHTSRKTIVAEILLAAPSVAGPDANAHAYPDSGAQSVCAGHDGRHHDGLLGPVPLHGGSSRADRRRAGSD